MRAIEGTCVSTGSIYVINVYQIVTFRVKSMATCTTRTMCL